MSTTTQIIATVADVSQVFLVIGLYVAWKQLAVTIKDIKLRSAREAGLIAIRQAEKFADEIIPALTEIHTKISGLPSAPNKLERFLPSEIHSSNLQKYKDALERLDNNPDVHDKILALGNKIESIAICFVKGIADEVVVFDTIGSAYCEMIEELYFFYCRYRRFEANPDRMIPYRNTITLYNTWKVRIEKIGFEADKKAIDSIGEKLDKKIKNATTKSTPIKALGTY
jgi:hypothetical protein